MLRLIRPLIEKIYTSSPAAYHVGQTKSKFSTPAEDVIKALANKTPKFVAPRFGSIVGISLCTMYGCCPKDNLMGLKFDNKALRALPVDSSKLKAQRQVSGACFSLVEPTPVKNPKLVCASIPALQLLGLNDDVVKSPELVEFFSGNKVLPGSETAAHCYCGHQFGYFSGQLGDGCAMYLGEVINSSDERWEIQIKGAGLTPYSRSADGRKVLRSSIREFLCSEAMHHLGIPTTRAGTCITSDSTVVRDIFYDGRPIHERCTMVLRIAQTFIRFGSFEIFKSTDRETGRAGPSVGQTDLLHKLLDYTVESFYNEIWQAHHEDKKTMYIEFYKEVIRRTACLVAEWQCVGWCHGVLNTDNMSIIGATIDYGPYGFIDKYDPDFICNGSDDGGRYTYRKQPEICKWNCMKLGEAIDKAVPVSETRPHLELFDEEFGKHYYAKMRKKFGLVKVLESDKDLIKSFFTVLQETGSDFTNCFRHLSELPLPSTKSFEQSQEKVLDYLLTQSSTLEELKTAYKPRMDKRQFAMFMMLAQTNPEILSALGRGAALLETEIDRMKKREELEESSEEQVANMCREKWSEWLKSYSDRLVQEEESVEDKIKLGKDRVQMMNSVNPRFILRNYIAQNAIAAAEKDDFSEVRRVLTLLQNPFSDNVSLQSDTSQEEASPEPSAATTSDFKDLSRYDKKPPGWALDLRVT